MEYPKPLTAVKTRRRCTHRSKQNSGIINVAEIEEDKLKMKSALLKGQASQMTQPPGMQLIICPIFSLLMNAFPHPSTPQKKIKKPNIAKYKIMS